MAQTESGRIAALDLIRGIAVLGILAVNIASFAASDSASYSPDLPEPGSLADHAMFGVMLLLFEGKMRALFSILFGASVLLFIERADAKGRDGLALQFRRLGWLALFGYLHFLLIWSGDILFIYACAGLLSLAFRQLSPKAMVAGALLLFAAWQAWGYAQWQPSLAGEAAMAAGTATPAQVEDHARSIAAYREDDRKDLAAIRGSWSGLLSHKLDEKAAMPLIGAIFVAGETLTYCLFGMALLSSGLFAGTWSRVALRRLATAGIGLGGLATLVFSAWAMANDFPEIRMRFAIGYGLGFAHLAMALGYLALIVLNLPRLLASRLGQRLQASGQMAFSNYLGTSLVMTAIFYGWGLGLVAQYGVAARWLFVLLGWALMLGWSKPWLARYRQGPLEWLWRSLTDWQLLPNRTR